MKIFYANQTLDEMMAKLENCVPEMVQVGAVFINYKLQKGLLDEQKEYNRKQLFWSRMLSIATIALVIVTLLLVKFN